MQHVDIPDVTDGGKRSTAFKVTFACRIPEALRNNSGYGAVVGIMRYNKMRHDADAASWLAVSAADGDAQVRRNECLLNGASLASVHSAAAAMRSSTPDIAVVTPMSNDDVDDEDAGTPEDALGFEAHRRMLDGSRDSSWVLTSPCRSSGWVTPASVRRSASVVTDELTNDRSDDDSDSVVPATPPPTPRDWDAMSLPRSPHNPMHMSVLSPDHRNVHAPS
jgi:hypothetical protein